MLTGMYPHSNGHWRNTHAPSLSAPDKDFGPQSRYRDIEKVGAHEDIPTLVEILNRDGFVMGEGSAVLVLESLKHAQARGARILAEISGYGATNDAYHISAPAENGAGAALCMQMALDNAQLDIMDIDYINAHGTSTELNDKSETAAIKTIFGEQAYNIPVSSTKSMTGHLLGASGALEAVICVQTLQHDILPPTIYYETPDPECDLDYVPNSPRSAHVDHVMSNSFGFGGHNATIIMSRYVEKSA